MVSKEIPGKEKKYKGVVRMKRAWIYVLLLFTALMLGGFIGVMVARCLRGVSEKDSQTEIVKKEQEKKDTGNTTENTAKETYPAAEYDFKLDEITIEIEGLTRGYDIAFVNDLHLITDKEAGDVAEENLQTVRERYQSFSVTEEGFSAEELWPQIVKFLNHYNFDAVVFGGDMLDYCSHANMELLTEGFDALRYSQDRVMYIRSDHDYGGWYGGNEFTDADGFILQSEFWDGDSGENCIEFEDFMLVGINKSYRNLSEKRLDFLNGKLESGKPVILVTHVPFYSEEDASLQQLSMDVRNRIYYWNKENSVYIPDAGMQAFIDRIYAKDSNVIQILAAHIHASWDGIVANDLREHVFAPAYEGNIGIIHIVAKENEGNIK